MKSRRRGQRQMSMKMAGPHRMGVSQMASTSLMMR